MKMFLGVWIVSLICSAGQSYADEPTTDYTVKPGDTCVSIATRELGDRRRYDKVHALNANLGPLPHVLKPGSILKLPKKKSDAPDAQLTAARGAVNVRKPATDDWGIAERGMPLFRAWRVGSKERSTAEVTFRDTSRLFMRENTIVIIYGPTTERASAASEAELETGALESRLAAASKRKVVVRTPSAEARLDGGTSLVVVDASLATVIANHGGGAAVVRGLDAQRKPRGARVQLAVGMGSKVKVGEQPSKPTPLPPAPKWQTSSSTFVDLAGRGATVVASWAPVAVAARYRVVIRASDERDIAAVTVAAPATAFEIHGLPAGRYVATTSVIDAEGFESVPSVELDVDVVAVKVLPPGSDDPLASPPPSADAASAPPLELVAGSRIVPEGETSCDVSDVAANTTAISCKNARGAMAAVPVHATSIRLCRVGCDAPRPGPISRAASTRLHFALEGSAGAALTARSNELAVGEVTRTATGLDVVVEPLSTTQDMARLAILTATGFELAVIDVPIAAREAIVAAAPRAPASITSIELGVTGGYRRVSTGADLGNPVDSARGVAGGPLAGVRATAWLHRTFGAEAELIVTSTTFHTDPSSAAIFGARGHLLARYTGERFGIVALIGGGFDSLLASSRSTMTESDSVVDGGLAATARFGHAWQLRLDARVALMGWFQTPELYLSVSRLFAR